MSENLDVVRSIYAAWERGDFSSTSPAPANEWASPEIEYTIVGGPSPGSWRGLGAMTDRWREFLSAWEGFHGEVDEYRELEDGRVLVLVSFRGRGKSSRLDLGQIGAKGAHVFGVREGQVTALAFYLDRDRALADLGLAE
jgi:ketosteroid isomerase-like protein